MYRTSGPVAMQPVGEMEFVAGIAAMSDSGAFGSTGVRRAAVGNPTGAVPRAALNQYRRPSGQFAQRTADITDPELIRKILDHVQKRAPPPQQPGRAEPHGILLDLIAER